MNSAEKEAVLHCLKVTIDEALCEDCPLYGTTGTYLCEKDCARLAINVLEQEPCTDAISREDALMALTGEYTDSPIELLPKAIKRINALPPVTPQYTEAEIQRMQELEQAEIQKAYEIGKEEGSSEKPNKWIPVSERLPEDSELVLFSTKTDRVFEGKYFADDTNQQWYAFRDECFAWNNNVTAWMPLPEPYKQEVGK